MAKFHGEVTLPNGMVMQMSYNSLCELEEITGRGALEILGSFEKGNAKMSDLRAFYFACLLRHQPDITFQDAGDIASEYPEYLATIIEAASPKVEAVEGNAAGAKTRKR